MRGLEQKTVEEVGQLALLGHATTVDDLERVRVDLRVRVAVLGDTERRNFAESVTAALVVRYWTAMCERHQAEMPVQCPPVKPSEFPMPEVNEYARLCAELPVTAALYQIGEFYTRLLPEAYRSKNGVFYTPPELVERTLDLLELEGADWSKARVFDPACGGAAFAAFVAIRMLRSNRSKSADDRISDIQKRLVGMELDRFSGWLSAVFLEAVCLPLLKATGRRLDGVVHVGDTLKVSPADLGLFDIVVGNPPYGKTRLEPADRLRFQGSLFGHANLYGLFMHTAVVLTRPGGLIGLVTPTSYLGGEYFKNLRDFLQRSAPPSRLSFVSDREHVFSDVLQETQLSVFRRGQSTSTKKRTHLECIQPRPDRPPVITDLGSLPPLDSNGGPWILPRSRQQSDLVRRLNSMPTRLADYGYRVATGQLVWNRHKDQFCDVAEYGTIPVLWAECVRADGTFAFSASSRSHKPFIRLTDAQSFLMNQEPCVLVQRTTSKEQTKRLIAAKVPKSFIARHSGYAVENHVNMVIPLQGKPAVSLATLAAVLNSWAVDQAFRCISGSVAVSAYELENMPLPSVDMLNLRLKGKSAGQIEATLETLYSTDD